MDAPELESLAELAREAGSLLLDLQGRADLEVRRGREGPSCRADLEVEARVRAWIGARYPGQALLAEEEAKGAAELPGAEGEPLWVVDPLDGTTNFLQGHPHFCVSIAYGRRVGWGFAPERAVVFHPPGNECFLAAAGAGATLNGRALRLDAGGLALRERSLGLSLAGGVGQAMAGVLAAARSFRGVRIGGAAALDLAYVACGRLGGLLAFEAKPWDLAAGALLVREAGGRASDTAGNESLPLAPSDLVAGPPEAHDQLLAALGPVR